MNEWNNGGRFSQPINHTDRFCSHDYNIFSQTSFNDTLIGFATNFRTFNFLFVRLSEINLAFIDFSLVYFKNLNYDNDEHTIGGTVIIS